jgi:hypothetical protein
MRCAISLNSSGAQGCSTCANSPSRRMHSSRSQCIFRNMNSSGQPRSLPCPRRLRFSQQPPCSKSNARPNSLIFHPNSSLSELSEARFDFSKCPARIDRNDRSLHFQNPPPPPASKSTMIGLIGAPFHLTLRALRVQMRLSNSPATPVPKHATPLKLLHFPPKHELIGMIGTRFSKTPHP